MTMTKLVIHSGGTVDHLMTGEQLSLGSSLWVLVLLLLLLLVLALKGGTKRGLDTDHPPEDLPLRVTRIIITCVTAK